MSALATAIATWRKLPLWARREVTDELRGALSSLNPRYWIGDEPEGPTYALAYESALAILQRATKRPKKKARRK
jgi:hypothetical protein